MAIPKIREQIEARVKDTGDTMTGLLTLSGNPTADFHAATKKYVDDNTPDVANAALKLTTNAGSSTLPVYFADGIPKQCNTSLGISITGNAATATKATQDGNGNVITSTYLPLSGGTLTGGLEIKNIGPMFTMTNSTSGQDMRLYPASNSVVLLNRNVAGNSTNYRALYLHNSTASSSINSALVFQDTVSGTTNNYNVLHAGNYNNYAPTKGGTGATGVWDISISGSSDYANYVVKQDTRSVNENPVDMLNGLSVHLKENTTSDGLNDGGTYHAAIHIKDWQDYSGGPFGQMAITGNSNFWFRVSTSGTAWGAWKKVLDSSNYTSYTVTKTGSGASGTWGISISGNAATATSATKATRDGNGATIASTYLKLAGGTMTGNITRNYVGTSWIHVTHGYACAIKLSAAASGGSASCLWSVKTNAGAWGCGGLSGNDNMYFSYGTDTNYNAGTNTLGGQIIFTPSGGIVVASNTEYTTYKARNIAANTSALTSGSSSLASGNIYVQYE